MVLVIVAPAATGWEGPLISGTRSTGGCCNGVSMVASLSLVSPSPGLVRSASAVWPSPSQEGSVVGAVLVMVIGGRVPPAGTGVLVAHTATGWEGPLISGTRSTGGCLTGVSRSASSSVVSVSPGFDT